MKWEMNKNEGHGGTPSNKPRCECAIPRLLCGRLSRVVNSVIFAEGLSLGAVSGFASVTLNSGRRRTRYAQA